MIQYRRLLTHEASKLVTLVERCYGDSYPVSLFYDQQQLQQKLHDELLISAVAEASNGDLIGHVGTMWEYSTSLTADAMTGMILEQYQRQGILAQLTQTLGTLYPLSRLTGLQLYSVTTHTASQRNGLEYGVVECGFLLPEFPSTMNAQGVVNDPLGQCNPALVMYYPINIPPQRRCYITADYRDIIDTIYERVNYPRLLLVDNGGQQLRGQTFGIVHNDLRKGVNRLCLQSIGADWDAYCSSFRNQLNPDESQCLDGQRTYGWYIDIPLSQPGAIALTEQLRTEGWFFGGIIFERQHGDYLRMQYCTAQIHRPALHIASEFGEKIVDFVFKDRVCFNRT